MKGKIYNIPYGVPFFETIAARFLENYKDEPLALSDVVFFVPNRRSVQNLKEAFLRQNGLTPFLLPKIVPVQEADEDELFFELGEVADLPVAISSEERIFLFAKMIVSKKSDYNIKDISFAQSLSLASDLGKLIDLCYQEGLSFDNIEKIVPEEYASHWQETLKFLKIVTAFWPEILKERKMIDAALRRNLLLEMKVQNLFKSNANRKIVAAGVGVPFEILKKVLRQINKNETGEIYIYGLDRYIDDEQWLEISETHPQFEKKELLKCLNVERSDVQDLTEKQNDFREKFVSEVMRQAQTTDVWRKIDENIKEGVKGVRLIEAEDGFQEAMQIALILREVLETPQKTAALVTSDRTLARLTADALKRFGVQIDDTAGLPLHLSPVGIFLRQIADVAEQNFAPNALAALKKNPYMRLGLSAFDMRQKVRDAEIEKRLPRYKEGRITNKDDALDKMIKDAFEEMVNLYEKSSVSFKKLLKAHIALAEKLAQDDESAGAQNLWKHEDGRLCAATLAKILDKAEIAGDIEPYQYGAALTTLLSNQMVRKPYGSHPRLKILGPIEARFGAFDVMIAGGLNEGVWPLALNVDPFMSRPMKKDFGLPLPEKSIGVAADDLSAILNAKEVYLTRALKTQGTPQSKSRYWFRIETVLQALGLNADALSDPFYQKVALKLDGLDGKGDVQSIEPACPRPPKSARPHTFSASSLKTLMESPYDIYASRILKLKKLNPLEEISDNKDLGILIHKILEEFCKKYPQELDENATSVLRQIATSELEKNCKDDAKKAFWKASIERVVDFVLKTEKEYRQNVQRVISEVSGKIVLNCNGTDVVLKATSDRIDETKDGCYQILDYKTGTPPSKSQVMKGYFPQLPLEAMIAQSGGLEKDGKKLPARKVKNLIYWGVQKEQQVPMGEATDELIEQTKEKITALMEAFDDEKTPYLYNPNPAHQNEFSDYEHLARYKEWKGKKEK
ncbi:MAG: PD-(D/E)XK nuclease family protein [Alphaproteobacteria bacterium]|nr:PD-(D/E)XK nuclease family protein [Alphaproteobacteria bacterium]